MVVLGRETLPLSCVQVPNQVHKFIRDGDLGFQGDVYSVGHLHGAAGVVQSGLGEYPLNTKLLVSAKMVSILV